NRSSPPSIGTHSSSGKRCEGAPVNHERLSDELARVVLGWRLAPGRYLKSERQWIQRSKFRPFQNLDDAFMVTSRASNAYFLGRDADGVFTATVRVGDREGRATSKTAAPAIALALTQALGIDAGAVQ